MTELVKKLFSINNVSKETKIIFAIIDQFYPNGNTLNNIQKDLKIPMKDLLKSLKFLITYDFIEVKIKSKRDV